jgi:diadenosine tetraphosphatase ApaH/serine/threonine PP2A family protein phosphatase
VNIGSVGQPRDHDTRACYVVLDNSKLLFRRVEYDYEATIKKILDTKKLPTFLAERLKLGK